MSFDEVAEAFDAAQWIYAKTMPQWPHHYTLKKTWADQAKFEAAVQFIRDFGYREKFGRSWYTRLDINGDKFWSMGAPIADTILVNRASIERVEAYDQIAASYDSLHVSEKSLAENAEIFKAIGYTAGKVLDIGCGTGLFLDYVKPDEYLGIDPSHAMLSHLGQRHPSAMVLPTAFESFYTRDRFDLIAALFGAASYIQPDAWSKLLPLLAPGGRAFLMYYRAGYSPFTHKAAGVDIPFHNYTGSPAGSVKTMGEFDVVTL